MSNKEAINKLALEIYDYLNELRGFDEWWEMFDEENQGEIINSMKQIIEDAADYL